MRKLVTAIGLASVLTLGPAAVSGAQTDAAAAQETEASDDDDSGMAGLAGLAGLLGLLGLFGLKRRDRRDVDYTTGTASGTSQR